MITCGREGKLVSKSKRKKKPMHNHGMAWHVNGHAHGGNVLEAYSKCVIMKGVVVCKQEA